MYVPMFGGKEKTKNKIPMKKEIYIFHITKKIKN